MKNDTEIFKADVGQTDIRWKTSRNDSDISLADWKKQLGGDVDE